MSAKALSIIIVTYNSAEVIESCLNPLRGYGAEIVLIDNDSHDNTVSVAEEFTEVRIIRSEENRGFAHAVNQGARESSGEYILLLNPDAVPNVDVIDTMLALEEQSHGRKIIGPLLFTPGRTVSTLNSGRRPSSWRMFCHFSGISRFSRFGKILEGFCKLWTENSDSEEADWVSGACLLVSRSAWEMLGGLNERWFMYAEDIDFCLRAKDCGLEVSFLGGHRMEHAIGGSDSTASMRMSSAWILNLYDLYLLRQKPWMFGATTWGIVVATGLLSRSCAYRLRALRAPTDYKVVWQVESRRFAIFARDVLGFSLRVWLAKARGYAAER